MEHKITTNDGQSLVEVNIKHKGKYKNGNKKHRIKKKHKPMVFGCVMVSFLATFSSVSLSALGYGHIYGALISLACFVVCIIMKGKNYNKTCMQCAVINILTASVQISLAIKSTGVLDSIFFSYGI